MSKLKKVKVISLILVACLVLMSMAGVGMAQRRHHYRHNPQAGKRKAAKRIGIGAGVGLGVGAIMGGKRGAAIGAGLGAAGGTAYHIHKKNQWNRRHRRY